MRPIFTHFIPPKREKKRVFVYDCGDREKRKNRVTEAVYPRYMIVCDRHSRFKYEPTEAFARRWAVSPDLWCDGCKNERDDKLKKLLG